MDANRYAPSVRPPGRAGVRASSAKDLFRSFLLVSECSPSGLGRDQLSHCRFSGGPHLYGAAPRGRTFRRGLPETGFGAAGVLPLVPAISGIRPRSGILARRASGISRAAGAGGGTAAAAIHGAREFRRCGGHEEGRLAAGHELRRAAGRRGGDIPAPRHRRGGRSRRFPGRLAGGQAGARHPGDGRHCLAHSPGSARHGNGRVPDPGRDRRDRWRASAPAVPQRRLPRHGRQRHAV
jgi:hypothetical protein